MTSDFAIALHILGFLASRRGEPLTSEEMARTYGTSPVIVRRVLGKLRRAGLVESRRGSGGGSVLARSPGAINLRQAYEAVSPEPRVLPRHPSRCNEVVPVVVSQFINDTCAEAERALLRSLEDVTVERMDRTVRSRIRRAMTPGGSVAIQRLRSGGEDS
ncbi:MAG: Rrf2 family transcriptional regulator [Planctomycetota bacterium]